MKNHFISPLLLEHQYIIIDFGFPCLLNIMIYFCFHSNTHFYSHAIIFNIKKKFEIIYNTLKLLSILKACTNINKL